MTTKEIQAILHTPTKPLAFSALRSLIDTAHDVSTLSNEVDKALTSVSWPEEFRSIDLGIDYYGDLGLDASLLHVYAATPSWPLVRSVRILSNSEEETYSILDSVDLTNVTRLTLSGPCGDAITFLSDSVRFPRLQALCLATNRIEATEELRRFARSPVAQHLSELRFGPTRPNRTEELIKVLFEGTEWPRLCNLSVSLLPPGSLPLVDAACPMLQVLHLSIIKADPLMELNYLPGLAAKLRTIGVSNCTDEMIELIASCPHLTSLETVSAPGTSVTGVGVAALKRAVFLDRLSSLSLSGNQLMGAGWVGLANLHCPHLHQLNLSLTGGDDEGIAALTKSSIFANLTYLDLSHNLLTHQGAQTLAKTGNPARLQVLNLFMNAIGDPGAIALCRSPLLQNVSDLDLAATDIGPNGLQALSSSQLSSLRTLNVGASVFDTDTSFAWARSRQITGLCELNLTGCRLKDTDMAALWRKEASWYQLHSLSLATNQLTADGLIYLLKNPSLTTLWSLDLSNNHLGPAGVEAIAASSTATRLTHLNISSCGFDFKSSAILANAPSMALLERVEADLDLLPPWLEAPSLRPCARANAAFTIKMRNNPPT